jgi:catechol 2,3-dioxygenase-like lactoylglutathione lyase family enzyme
MLVALSPREPSGGSQGTAMDHFGFKVRNLEAFLAKWRAAGLPVTGEFTGAEGFPNAYVMAPDDIRVELQEDQTLSVEASAYHIHFLTPEYEGLLDWYIETFSLERRARGRLQTTADAPGMNLSFGNAETPTVGTRGRAIDHIGFEVDNLKAFCKMLEARGIEFDVAFREVASVELNIAYFTDPSGVYIELTEGYDEY